MLLIEARFSDFTKKPISDARKQTEVLLALEVESRKAVTDLLEKALAAGGSLYLEPQEHGWMFAHSFAALDGHQWEESKRQLRWQRLAGDCRAAKYAARNDDTCLLSTSVIKAARADP